MRRFPFNPFPERDDNDFLPPKDTPDFINDRRRLTVAQARALQDESKAVRVIRNAGITFHRPCPSYVWCDHHGAIHEAKFDVYGEGDGVTSECALANWRNVFVESIDPEEDFG